MVQKSAAQRPLYALNLILRYDVSGDSEVDATARVRLEKRTIDTASLVVFSDLASWSKRVPTFRHQRGKYGCGRRRKVERKKKGTVRGDLFWEFSFLLFFPFSPCAQGCARFYLKEVASCSPSYTTVIIHTVASVQAYISTWCYI